MAKIKQNNFLDTVDEVFTSAKKAGVLHLHAEGNHFSGRTIQINGKSHYHFGTTGYLGLEQDKRLKEAAVHAIEQYGTQFPLSKSYISHPLYSSLEEKVGAMYGTPVIITKNSTLGHLAVIPTAVRDEDGVILDHQVHWSVQNATSILKTRGVPVEMIRHNHLEMLEDKIKQLTNKCQKIWYMADGVYSMYGDYAPVEELLELSKKYPQLHIYFDDVHGMSWNGENGTGYIKSVLKDLPENVLLFGTLSKTFGASGAVAVSTDEKLYSKIKTFGGPLTFSAQLEPASVGAAIASADIHLSPEIYKLQAELQAGIGYFNKLLEKTELPLINKNTSPVFYIGTGMPVTGYNFVQRLLKEGFYVNLGIYPAVPVKNTGVRITISRHNKASDIKALVKAMEYHHPKAMEETDTNMIKVRKAFRMPVKTEITKIENSPGMKLEVFDSIEKISKETWNSLFSGKGVLDWEGQLFLQNVFSGHDQKEYNWNFLYAIIRDVKDTIILAAPMTKALWKDDLLAPASTSLKVEAKRKQQGKYYLTSQVLSLGSMFTEGDHLYFNENHSEREKALGLLVDKMEEWESETSMLVLRDFDADTPLNNFLHDRGFVKATMPDCCFFEDFSWKGKEDFPSILSKKSRRHFFKDIKPYEELIVVEVIEKVPEEYLTQFLKLYENVRRNNPGLNTFPFPPKLFAEMNENPNWEFICLSVKQEKDGRGDLVGVMFCYKNSGKTYVPSFVGMDYDCTGDFSIYRQLLYHTILRAKELEFERIDFGLTASFEKKKLGAKVKPKVCYVQAKDNFSLELLETLQNSR